MSDEEQESAKIQNRLCSVQLRKLDKKDYAENVVIRTARINSDGKVISR